MSNSEKDDQKESTGPTEPNTATATPQGEREVATSEDEYETVDPETRTEVLNHYDHRCQVCGRSGPGAGGLATLHVHHIERDPDGMDVHDVKNLSLMCRMCHGWVHLKHTSADSPIELTDEDERVLLTQDIEILRFLEKNGPARTGDIASGLSNNHSVTSVRERLWVLMGLDNLVETRNRQIVDKDVETGEWGLVDQIETSVRGHIPDDPKLLLQRMEDEQVRQAIDRGCDRSDIMDVFDVTRRTTFHKEKRAAAYDFPLAAFSRGGRPTEAEESIRDSNVVDSSITEDDDQTQRVTDTTLAPDEEDQTETWGTTETDPDTRTLSDRVEAADHSGSETESNADDEELRMRLQAVFNALEKVQHAL